MFKRVPVVYLSLLGILELVLGVGTLCKSMGQSFCCRVHLKSTQTLRRGGAGSSDCQVVQSEKSMRMKVQNDKISNLLKFEQNSPPAAPK